MFQAGKFSVRTSLLLTLTIPALMNAGPFLQTNLASDIPGLAAFTDPNLKNPWGMSASATSPFWVSDQGSGKSTLYVGSGAPQALVVTTPGNGVTPPQGPTGQVFNSAGAGNFLLPGGAAATFLFATLSGTIDGWNGAQATTASIQFIASDQAVYTGLANGASAAGNVLYVADFANAKIDVVNSVFSKISLAGSFVDPNLPAGYSPYNIQNIGGKLYVEYAFVDPTTHLPSTTANTGIVSVFSLDGAFQQRLVTNSHLNSPWGVALAPAGFGSFGGDLLVGNFGDGTISGFDPVTGAFLGTLSNSLGNPIVNSGLWAIQFHGATSTFDPNTLYFTAGINNEVNGLFGSIQAVPEPSTLSLAIMALGSGILLRRKLFKA